MPDDEKAQLYKQIVRQADEQTLLERMRIHGFWPADQGLPPDPPAEVAERVKVEAEIAQLQNTQSLAKDPERALAEEKKRRWEASKQRRAEAKERGGPLSASAGAKPGRVTGKAPSSTRAPG